MIVYIHKQGTQEKDMAPGTKPSRGGAEEIELNRKPINRIQAFCPRATAEGMAELVSVVQTGYLSWKQGTGFMEVWCELSRNKCCTDLSGISQTERKGWPIRSKSARRAGLRTLGLTQKVGMANVPAKVCMASGKKINLLFCNMNTYKDRKSI